MTRPVDAVRRAVRAALGPATGRPLALVACSGGPDSLALAAGTASVAGRLGWRAGAVVVDHGLQRGSAQIAAATAEVCRGLGLDPVRSIPVVVAPGPGPEAAAREARYAALAAAALAAGASVVLLGHTRDDQAETVLLGLARGSGARSLQGMPIRAPLPGALGVELVRPLLQLPRSTVAAACERWGLRPWADPHNSDPAYRRARVRHELMPVLVSTLGPGAPAALARTAELLRDDQELLQRMAGEVLEVLPQSPLCSQLASHPAAIRRRVLHALAVRHGCPPTALTSGHLFALDRLVTSGREGGDVRLPGGIRARVRYGRLDLAPSDRPQQE